MARIDVRDRQPGEFLDDIPLVRCPACGKTGFSLGHPREYGEEVKRVTTYCHVVENLTKTSGIPIETCDHRQRWFDFLKGRA